MMNEPVASPVVRLDAEIAALRVEVRSITMMREETDRRYEQRFLAQEKAVSAALSAAEKAVERAEINAEKWRMNANEWRGAMDDRERNYVMKDSMDTRISALQKEVDALRLVATTQEGKGVGMEKMWGYILAAVTAAGAVGITVAFVSK
jgi:hypothetical protein